MYRLYIFIASFGFCALCFVQSAFCQTDPGLQPVTKAEIKRIAETVPLKSSQQTLALSRAYRSGVLISRFAYEEYKSLLNKKKDDPQATLLAATATLFYYNKLDDTRPKGPFVSYQTLLDEAGTLFRRAMFLDPNSPRTLKYYGNYMFRNDHNQGKQIGLLSLQRSANIDPKDAGVHAILGDIYANPYNGGYEPERAEQELLKAVALDPTWASPHNRLIGLYLWEKKPAKVRQQVAAYRKLLPNPEKSDRYLKSVLDDCAKMEKAQAQTKPKR